MFRRLFQVTAMAVLLLQASGMPVAGAVTALYPDLKTVPPRDLRFDRTDVSADGSGELHNVLRFSNTVWNAGQGKLSLRALIDPKTLSGPAIQRVYNTDGTFSSYTVGSMYYHAVHQHYHYDNWGRYELWTKADYDAWVASGRSQGQPKKLGTKTTSCVEDEEFIDTLPATPWPAVYTGAGCLPDSQNVINEGLSPGWGDTYDYYRFEQWIDLDQLPIASCGFLCDGQYVLRSIADPLNKIYESPDRSDSSRESEQDNEAITVFTVSGGAIIDGAAPTGTVAINHVDPIASTPEVSVSVLGRDDVSGVDQVRLSNDGTTWDKLAYTGNGSVAQNVPWNLNDPTYGGTTGDGPRTVYAQVHDKSGNWSTTFSDSITLDTTSSNYVASVMSDGPSGYWRLGESPGSSSAGDRAGSSTGSYMNGPTLGVPGLIATDPGTAISLDGVNDYVDIPSSPSLSPSAAVSVEAWIKPDSIPATGFESVLTKPESYTLQFNSGRLEFTTMQNGVRRRTLAPAGAIVAGHAYQIVGTYDGSVQRLYINGAVAATTNPTGPLSANANAVHIGSWNGAKEFFAGIVDDAAVYPTALSAARVLAHFNVANGPGTVKQYTLTVAVAGTGSGIVNSQPAGIACPTACSASFDDGTLVVVTPVPSSTSTFSGWSGGCSGAGACQVTMSAARSVTATFVPSSYASSVTADTPVGYWRLGDVSGTKALDGSTDPHDGTYLNGITLHVSGLIPSDLANSAVRLDGANDYVRIPNHPGKNPATVVSIEAWIKPGSVPASGAFASIVTKPGSYSLQFNGSRLEFTIVQNGVYRRLQAQSGAIVAGTSYHIVGVYDGGHQRLYINGALAASRTQTGPITQNNNNVYLGSWNGSKEFFKGTLDEVAIYGFALSATRITAHYDTAVTI